MIFFNFFKMISDPNVYVYFIMYCGMYRVIYIDFFIFFLFNRKKLQR